jgi:hypothetical protein
MDVVSLNEEQDLPGQGPRQQVPELSKLLVKRREECHIPETLSHFWNSMEMEI